MRSPKEKSAERPLTVSAPKLLELVTSKDKADVDLDMVMVISFVNTLGTIARFSSLFCLYSYSTCTAIWDNLLNGLIRYASYRRSVGLDFCFCLSCKIVEEQ
jgi:hypothetical protein